MEPDAPRTCPYCAMPISTVTRSCPHCNEAIASGVRARMEGGLLVVVKHATFPMTRCLFCAGHDHVQPWAKKFVFAPSWISIVALVACLCTRGIGLIVMFIVYLVMRKTQWLTLPRCGPCRDRQTTAAMGGWLSAGGAVIGLPAGMWALGRLSGVHDGEFYGILGGLLAALVLLLVIQNVWINRRTVICKQIDDECVRLRVPNPELTVEALSEMSEHRRYA